LILYDALQYLRPSQLNKYLGTSDCRLYLFISLFHFTPCLSVVDWMALVRMYRRRHRMRPFIKRLPIFGLFIVDAIRYMLPLFLSLSLSSLFHSLSDRPDPQNNVWMRMTLCYIIRLLTSLISFPREASLIDGIIEILADHYFTSNIGIDSCVSTAHSAGLHFHSRMFHFLLLLPFPLVSISVGHH
jgi:hypothetical protein